MVNLKNKKEFSEFLLELSDEIGFKVSARGWAYILEQKRYINKNEFDKVTNAINSCRKKGYLPIDFTAEEAARQFEGVEIPDHLGIVEAFGREIDWAKNVVDIYTPNWWAGEEYYIQIVVEKIDLVTLFYPVCKEYHIPIANSKGWSSMYQRAEYARRFAEAEENGLQCVLLYCGDHDPDGLRISDFLRKNLSDLQDIKWEDGFDGYNPENLIIDRFGLNYDFILENDFTWIDNLITGSGKNLASPKHKNYAMPYVQDYLKTVGERKCEANAIVTLPRVAEQLVRDAIEKYLGPKAKQNFAMKQEIERDELNKFLTNTNAGDLLKDLKEEVSGWRKDYGI